MLRLSPFVFLLAAAPAWADAHADAAAACPEGSATIHVVEDHDARPEAGDDTAALAAAMAAARGHAGPSCLYFPAGHYETQIGLDVHWAVPGGLALVGAPGATLAVSVDTPLITTTNWLRVQPGDGLAIEGLALQGAPRGVAPLIFAHAIDDTAEPYAAKGAPATLDDCLDDRVVRLPLRLDHVRLENTGGPAVHINSLIDAELRDVAVEGPGPSDYGVYLSGSRGRLAVDGFVDPVSELGVFVANGARRACVDLEDVTVNGGLYVSVGEGSWVETQGVQSAAPPFHLYLRESTGRFRDSAFASGPSRFGVNGELYYPRDAHFDRVRFTAARGTPNALVIYWSVGQAMVTGQSVRFDHTQFQAPSGASRALFVQASSGADDNTVSMWGGQIGPGFQTGVELDRGGNLAVNCMAMDAQTGFHLDVDAQRACAVELSGVDYGATATPTAGTCTAGQGLVVEAACDDPIAPIETLAPVEGPIGESCFPPLGSGCPAAPGTVLYLAPSDFPRATDRGEGTVYNPFADPQAAVDALRAAIVVDAPEGEQNQGAELRVFGGRYPVVGEHLDLSGISASACDPAVMRAVGDRPAEFTAAQPAWRDPSPGEWARVVEGDVTYYRSPTPVTALYTDDWIIYDTSSVPFFGYYRHGDEWIALVSYDRREEFTAAHSDFVQSGRNRYRAGEPYYVGPGVYFDQPGCRAFLEHGRGTIDACHLLLRLDPTRTGVDLGYGIDPDPSTHELLLFNIEQVNLDRAAHLRVHGIEFIGINRVSAHNANNLTIDGNTILHRAYLDLYNSADTLDEAGGGERQASAHTLRVSGNRISQGFPHYVYYNDLKAGVEYPGVSSKVGPATRFHHPAVLLRDPDNSGDYPEVRGPRCAAVTDNIIERVWFGISAAAADDATVSHNHIEFAHDDGIVVYGRESQRVEVSHNAIFDSLNGISQVPVGHDMSMPAGATSVDGPFWVHHNVVDLSRTMDWPIPDERAGYPSDANSRNGAPGDFDYGFVANYALFVGHATGQHTAMQVYNNVFITTNSPEGRGAVVVPYNHGGAVRGHFMNNVVVQRDPQGHIYAVMNTRDQLPDMGFDPSEAAGAAGTLVDGNLYWRGGQGGVPGAEAPFTYIDAASCDGTDVYGASPYLFGDFDYTTDLSDDDCPAQVCLNPPCSFVVDRPGGDCVKPVDRNLTWRSLRDLLCHNPVTPHAVRVEYTDESGNPAWRYDPIDPVVSSQSWQTEGWLTDQWAGFMAHDRFVDPALEAGTYRVSAAHRAAAVTTPAAWPEGGASYVGACGDGPCVVGPRP